MHSAMRGALRFLLLLPVTLSIGAVTAPAREGFYLGAGIASVTASGDLKGNHFITNTAGTEAEVLGSLSPGAGFALEIGYGFNKYLGVEYLGTGTFHNATTNKSVIPVNDTRATVGTALIGLRLTAPVAQRFELFARLGAASSSVLYDEYSVPGTAAGPAFTPSGKGSALSISGTGSGYGAGFEVLGEHLGFELSYNVLSIAFDQAKGSVTSGSLPKAQKEEFTVTVANVLYHF
jgi:hypothetical protein